MTLEEAIAYVETVARANESLVVIERFDGSLAYSTNSKEICQYIADLLKELKERRKMPEIITCGECAHRYVEGNHVRFNRCELNHNNVQSDDWYCGDAERRTE